MPSYAFVEVDSTPVNPSMDSMERNNDGTNKDGAIKGYLQTLLREKVIREYPVVDFVDTVWRFQVSDLKVPLCGFVLKKQFVDEYIERKYNKELFTSMERTAYDPLVLLFKDIIKQLGDAGNRSATNVSIVNMQDRYVHGHFANFRPDFVWSWSNDNAKQSWALSALSGDLKKTVTTKVKYKKKIDMTLIPEVRPA